MATDDINKAWAGYNPRVFEVAVERAKAMKSESVPRFEHDCPRCIFLGTWVDAEDHHLDLYWCTQSGGMPTAIARYGDEGPDYISGLQGMPDNLIGKHESFCTWAIPCQAWFLTTRFMALTPWYLARKAMHFSFEANTGYYCFVEGTGTIQASAEISAKVTVSHFWEDST